VGGVELVHADQRAQVRGQRRQRVPATVHNSDLGAQRDDVPRGIWRGAVVGVLGLGLRGLGFGVLGFQRDHECGVQGLEFIAPQGLTLLELKG
jgi:hypothetical protein